MTAPFIKPTPGRIVYFWPHPSDTISNIPGEPLAAQISCVHSDREVNLSVLDAGGTHFPRSNVTLVQDGDERPNCSYATWMPYQLGQAAKAEEDAPFEPEAIEDPYEPDAVPTGDAAVHGADTEDAPAAA